MYLPSTTQPGRLHNMKARVAKPARLFHEYSEDELREAMTAKPLERGGLKRCRKAPQAIVTADRERKLLRLLRGGWADYETIAATLRLSENTIVRLCRDLARRGMVEKSYAPRRGSAPGRAIFRAVEGADSSGNIGQWRRKEGGE